MDKDWNLRIVMRLVLENQKKSAERYNKFYTNGKINYFTHVRVCVMIIVLITDGN